MRISISEEKARKSLWAWLFWGLGTYFVLELGPFFIASAIFKKTARELAGPYLAFAVPAVIVMPLIWWLRKWEELGALPERLARGWGLSMALFGVALAVAVFYSGVELRLVDLQDAVVEFFVSGLMAGFILYFVGYHRTLKVLTSRAIEKQAPTNSGACSRT